MGLIDYIILAVILVIIAAVVLYIYRAKKSGQKCIGCPHSKSCSGCCDAVRLQKSDSCDTMEP